MLAILFNIANESQTKSILDYIINNNVITKHGAPVVYKSYNLTDIYTPFLFVGLTDYQNGLIWLWISCLVIVAMHKNGYQNQALELFNKISTLIVNHDTAYEVYTQKGKPVNRLFYKSEKGFAWTSGLFVWAYHQCELSSDS